MREKSWEYAGRTVDEAVEIALEESGLRGTTFMLRSWTSRKKAFWVSAIRKPGFAWS